MSRTFAQASVTLHKANPIKNPKSASSLPCLVAAMDLFHADGVEALVEVTESGDYRFATIQWHAIATRVVVELERAVRYSGDQREKFVAIKLAFSADPMR